ncbi:Collagen Alpha-1(Xxviii) Chain [Manis pentadactyla]|nr:Collagen Alpha-1(Xxviii) Chain [Manis pentadactyla]
MNVVASRVSVVKGVVVDGPKKKLQGAGNPAQPGAAGRDAAAAAAAAGVAPGQQRQQQQRQQRAALSRGRRRD